LAVKFPSELSQNYGFIGRYSLDYSKKEIKLYVASLQFKFKFVSAVASINGAELPAHLSNSFNFENKTQFVTNIPFHNAFIDLFGSEDRAVVVKFSVIVQKDAQEEVTSNIELKIPFVMQKELEMAKSKPVNPEKAVQDMYRHEFNVKKMGANEKELYAKLEDFKKTKIEDRYRKHGYGEMLTFFLDIEDCVEMTAFQKLSINDVQLLPTLSKNCYKILMKGEVPEYSCSVKLVPMDLYTPGIETRETQEIKATIKEYHKKYIVIEIKQYCRAKSEGIMFDVDEEYRLELVPNFYSTTMAKQAINRIQEHGAERFILDFTKASEEAAQEAFGLWPLKDLFSSISDIGSNRKGNLAVRSGKAQIFKKFDNTNFKWMNKNVGKNKSQMNAVKSIVNRTSFPSPFIVFGGPGCGKTSLAVEAVSFISLFNYVLLSKFESITDCTNREAAASCQNPCYDKFKLCMR
jgi:hypothetical protein